MMQWVAAAILLGVPVLAAFQLPLRFLYVSRRPFTERLVDYLYRRAMRAAALAVAADRALVAHRDEVAEIKRSHRPHYKGLEPY
jgi:hypothetical protein